jgi:hypothetical protein
VVASLWSSALAGDMPLLVVLSSSRCILSVSIRFGLAGV